MVTLNRVSIMWLKSTLETRDGRGVVSLMLQLA
jgi:hypothetical protein